MALVLADRVRETTFSSGTSDISLAGAVTGYQSFAVIGNTNTTYYCIAGQGTNEWEVGIGTYIQSTATLERTTVLSNSAGTQPNKLSFSTGTKDVFVTYAAEKSVVEDLAQTLTNKTLGSGTAVTAGTINNATIGASTPSTGAFTSLTSNSTTTLNGTTIPASKTLVDTDSSQTLTNKSLTSPTITGTGTAAFGNLSYTGTLTGGTGVINIGSGQVYKDASGNVGIGTSSPQGKFDVVGSVANTLATFSTADAATTVLNNTDGSAFGRNSKILFRTAGLNLSGIASVYTGFNGAGDVAGALAFGTQANAAGGIVERLRIDSSGNVGIGTSSPDFPNGGGLVVYNNDLPRIELRNSVTGSASTDGAGMVVSGQDFILYNRESTANIAAYTAGAERLRIDASGRLLVGTTVVNNGSRSNFDFSGFSNGIETTWNGTNSIYHVLVRNANGFLGGINTNGSTTTYTNLSDYRVKENVKPMVDALNTVSKLKPCTFTYKVDGSAGQGFIAHELQEVCPDCVTGEKDAVDEEGNPQYQGVDTSFLVGILTKAIQEQQAMIVDLKARIEQLENQ